MEQDDVVRYAMVESGPAVVPDEVETHERAVEVVVMWGEQVLHVSHLPADGSFHVGEPASSRRGAVQPDWLVGADVIGTDRLPIVVAGAAGPTVVLAEGATGTVTVAEQSRSFGGLRADGKLAPCAELAGAEQYALPDGATAHVEHRGFTFIVRPVAAGRRIGVGLAAIAAAFEQRPLTYLAGSIALASLLFTIFYFLPPSGSGLALQDIDSDSRLADFFVAQNEVLTEDAPEWLDQHAADDGGEGERHALEEGQAGDPDNAATTNRQAVEGPEDNEDPHMANQSSPEVVANAGILGVLRTMSGDFRAPTSPFGRDQALGNDPMSALGAIMGDQIGENFGFNGLGLRGTGRGAGGTGLGTYGLGSFGTIGRGGGHGDSDGYGIGADGGLRGPVSHGPSMHPEPPEVMGGLSKETIRRVMHRHRNEVRYCYEQQLTSRPDLAGRVTVQFLISPAGAVSSSAVVPARSNLNDNRVEGCVASAVRRWSFPQPDNGGMVSVAYPFMFNAN